LLLFTFWGILFFNNAALAVLTREAVGPHGQFFGCDHTQERYREAFYTRLLSNWQNFENRKDADGLWAHRRANIHFKRVLNGYTPQPMNSGIHDKLLNFVNRRKPKGGTLKALQRFYATSRKMHPHQVRV
jgi:trimethylamine---corrinoid protein Co-methyltransferase